MKSDKVKEWKRPYLMALFRGLAIAHPYLMALLRGLAIAYPKLTPELINKTGNNGTGARHCTLAKVRAKKLSRYSQFKLSNVFLRQLSDLNMVRTCMLSMTSQLSLFIACY